MPSRPILVLCEGSHDIAFLGRLLEASAGAQPLKKAIKDLSPPFGDFFAKRFGSRNAEDAKFHSSGPVLPDEPPLLESAWSLPDDSRRWYFLNCNGDNRSKEVSAFLSQVVALAQIPEPEKGILEMGIVLVNDADDIGTAARMKFIIQNYADTLKPILPNFATLIANSVIHHHSFGAGACIFSAREASTGTLEDIAWPLMRAAFPKRHDEAHAFTNNHAEPGTKIASGTPPSRKLKAAITIAGQPECPGFSAAVILRDSIALKDEELRQDPSCIVLQKVLSEV